jgi:hypothetical protein
VGGLCPRDQVSLLESKVEETNRQLKILRGVAENRDREAKLSKKRSQASGRVGPGRFGTRSLADHVFRSTNVCPGAPGGDRSATE